MVLNVHRNVLGTWRGKGGGRVTWRRNVLGGEGRGGEGDVEKEGGGGGYGSEVSKHGA